MIAPALRVVAGPPAACMDHESAIGLAPGGRELGVATGGQACAPMAQVDGQDRAVLGYRPAILSPAIGPVSESMSRLPASPKPERA